MYKPRAVIARAAASLILSGLPSGVSHAAPTVKVRLTGTVHPTPIAGAKGAIVSPLGEPNSSDTALWGLHSKETGAFSNAPCWVQVSQKSVNDDKDTKTDPKSLCGGKSLTDIMGADFAPTDQTGPRAFISGVSVCLNKKRDRIKGYTLHGRKIDAGGAVEDLALKAPGPVLPNCDDWQPAVDCLPGEIAIAADIHFGAGSAPNSWKGIALKCRAVTISDGKSLGTIDGVGPRMSFHPTAGKPFKALTSTPGHVLVSVTNGTQSGIQVFNGTAAGTLEPACVNTIKVNPKEANDMFYFPGGADLTLGLESLGTAFFHVSDLTGCRSPALVLASEPAEDGALEPVVTRDGKFALVVNEYGPFGGSVAVVSIARDSHGNFTSASRTLGNIPTLGHTLDGVALSPDGRRLYVSSEVGNIKPPPSSSGWPLLFKPTGGCPQNGTDFPSGVVTVIDVTKALKHPDATAIISTVAAGCSPGRMALTSDGKVLWVAARGDNRVLAFDPAALEANPNNALLSFVDTGGTAPVGIALFHQEHLLAVANSNRFADSSPGSVTFLDVSKPDRARLVATVGAQLFPREVTVGPDDSTIYVTNFDSSQLQVIETTEP